MSVLSFPIVRVMQAAAALLFLESMLDTFYPILSSQLLGYPSAAALANAETVSMVRCRGCARLTRAALHPRASSNLSLSSVVSFGCAVAYWAMQAQPTKNIQHIVSALHFIAALAVGMAWIAHYQHQEAAVFISFLFVHLGFATFLSLAKGAHSS